MYEADVCKEYLRNAFHGGWLDLGGEERIEGFVRIFAGEMESLIAIDHAPWLGEDRALKLLRLAKPTQGAIDAWTSWKQRINA